MQFIEQPDGSYAPFVSQVLVSKLYGLDKDFTPTPISELMAKYNANSPNNQSEADEANQAPNTQGEAEADEMPIVLTGDEFGEFDLNTVEGKKALREVAYDKLVEMAKTKQSVFCKALNDNVYFNVSGAKKFKSLSADPRKIILVAAIKDIIKQSKLVKTNVQSYDAQEKRRGITYSILKTKVSIKDEEFGVRLLVRKLADGQYQYDFQVKDSYDGIFDSIDVKKEQGRSVNKSDVLTPSTNNTLFDNLSQELLEEIIDDEGEYVADNNTPLLFDTLDDTLDGIDDEEEYVADESQISLFDGVMLDAVSPKMVLNLFVFDKDGNEIFKDEPMDAADEADEANTDEAGVGEANSETDSETVQAKAEAISTIDEVVSALKVPTVKSLGLSFDRKGEFIGNAKLVVTDEQYEIERRLPWEARRKLYDSEMFTNGNFIIKKAPEYLLNALRETAKAGALSNVKLLKEEEILSFLNQQVIGLETETVYPVKNTKVGKQGYLAFVSPNYDNQVILIDENYASVFYAQYGKVNFKVVVNTEDGEKTLNGKFVAVYDGDEFVGLIAARYMDNTENAEDLQDAQAKQAQLAKAGNFEHTAQSKLLGKAPKVRSTKTADEKVKDDDTMKVYDGKPKKPTLASLGFSKREFLAFTMDRTSDDVETLNTNIITNNKFIIKSPPDYLKNYVEKSYEERRSGKNYRTIPPSVLNRLILTHSNTGGNSSPVTQMLVQGKDVVMMAEDGTAAVIDKNYVDLFYFQNPDVQFKLSSNGMGKIGGSTEPMAVAYHNNEAVGVIAGKNTAHAEVAEVRNNAQAAQAAQAPAETMPKAEIGNNEDNMTNTETTQEQADIDYLNSIINGTTDLWQADEIEARMEEIYARLTKATEPLFEEAAEAFAQFAISLEV